VSASIEAVTAFDRVTRTAETLSGGSCEFAYRSSRFKTRDAGRFVICDVTFRLGRLAPAVKYPDLQRYLDSRKIVRPTLGDVRNAVLAVRRAKGMVIDRADVDTNSVGSFFTNPVCLIRWSKRSRAAAVSVSPDMLPAMAA
jgi:UDP-N-acetylmuramate dehydrogenase